MNVLKTILASLVLAIPRIADASVILADQYREVVAFAAVGQFASATELIDRVSDQHQQEATTFDSWSALETAFATLGTGNASASASQVSTVGPLVLEATGSVGVSVSGSHAFGAVGSARSDTYFEFILTTPYQYVWTATVTGAGVGAGGGGSRATFENFDTGVIAETGALSLLAPGAGSLTSTSTGTLDPGEHYWDASASMFGSANGSLEPTLSSSEWSASYHVRLTLLDDQPALDPPQAVPEPASLLLLGLGLGALAIARRRL